MAAELDLGELRLTVAKSDFEVHSTTTALFSRPETQDGTSRRLHLDLCNLGRSWVQRGRGLQLQVKVLVEGKPPCPALLQSLNTIICKAKTWSQLGLKASSVTSTQDSSERHGIETVAIALSYDAHSREQSKDNVHRLCYTMPATDVVPPAGIEVLGLDAVRLELGIERKTGAKKRKQRKQKENIQNDGCRLDEPYLLHSSMLLQPLLLIATEEDAILRESPTDSGYESLFSTQTSHGEGDDEMLLTGVEAIEEDENGMLDVPAASTSSLVGSYSDMQTSTGLALIGVKDHHPKKRSADFHDASDELEPLVIPPDCITSLVDAVLRLSIEEKPWRLRQGLRVRSNCIVSRLSDISPGLWSPGYLKEMSTRAPLLPTVAHALSHSIYINATSPTLKARLQTLLYYGIDDDADGEADEEFSIRGTDEIAPKTRFELMSALLWQVMQKRLYRPDTTRRLKSLTKGLETTDEPANGEADENLFPSTDADGGGQHCGNDFMFQDGDDDENDIMEYADFEEDLEDEFLFEERNYLKSVADGDEDGLMLHGQTSVEHAEEGETDLMLQDHPAAEGDEEEHEDLFGRSDGTVDLDEDDLLLQDLDG